MGVVGDGGDGSHSGSEFVMTIISHLPQLLMAACLLFIIECTFHVRSRYAAPFAFVGLVVPIGMLWFGGFWTP